jgi:hypothetical protein
MRQTKRRLKMKRVKKLMTLPLAIGEIAQYDAQFLHHYANGLEFSSWSLQLLSQPSLATKAEESPGAGIQAGRERTEARLLAQIMKRRPVVD